MSEHYEVLQVSPRAEPEVIAAAYKALARKYHPDHHPDKAMAEERMARINEAWEALSRRAPEPPPRVVTPPPVYEGFRRYGRARGVDAKGKEHDVTVLEMDLKGARVRCPARPVKLVLSLGFNKAPATVEVRSAEGRGDEWVVRFEPLGGMLARVVAYLE